jgi:hypothetical protein
MSHSFLNSGTLIVSEGSGGKEKMERKGIKKREEK